MRNSYKIFFIVLKKLRSNNEFSLNIVYIQLVSNFKFMLSYSFTFLNI